MDSAAVAMCLVTPEGRFTKVNEAACRFFGIEADALMKMSFQDLTPQEYLEAELRNFVGIIEGRIDSYRMVKHFPRSDGRVIYGDITVSGVRDENGDVREIIGHIVDVTVEVEARQQISEQNERNRILAQQLQQQNETIAASERRYRLLADNAVDVIIHCRGSEIVWASPSVAPALGIEPQEFIGSNFNTVIHPDDIAPMIASFQSISPDESLLNRFRIRAADGSYHWVDSHARPYVDAIGNSDGLILALRIVDAQVEAEQRLEQLACFDTVTGLANRAETMARLESEVTRLSPGRNLAILFCDLDKFKRINDTLGHNAGDAVLRAVAERISQCVRHTDTVGRIGGDEFLVLLPACRASKRPLESGTRSSRKPQTPSSTTGLRYPSS
jgi:PAS domain S-box-containing protein